MKLLTATALLITAISVPALAETPTQRQLHSWDYVNQVATAAQAPVEAPVEEHHEAQHSYYHHESEPAKGKHHHGKHHEGSKHHEGAKHHHHAHHHHKKASKAAAKDEGKTMDKPAEQPKQ